MKIETTEWFLGLAKAVAVATVIGGGTIVLDAQRDNALQDQRDEQHERRFEKLDETLSDLNRNVQSLDKNVAILTERIKEQERRYDSRN